jgi:hypothetical protein
MGVDAKHPLFNEFEPDWRQMRDTYRGQRVVKNAGQVYLPPTSGMVADGMTNPNDTGFLAYQAYKLRAVFPDVVSDAVEALIGVMHRKPATIELPDSMEFLRDRATARNESLHLLLRRLNEEQLVTGRAGLLADVADSGERSDEPYISLYHGERIINWDEGRSDGIEVQNLNFVSIDETEFERGNDFEWTEQQKYRVLILAENETNEAVDRAADGADGDGTDPVDNIPIGSGVYRMGVFRDDRFTFAPSELITPSIRGRSLNSVPFVFCNSKDVVADPDDPPLIGLSNLALTIYRGEADYRQGLFMQGQDTLVVIGAADDDDHRVGSGATINLPQSGDAKYIGVSSAGIPEMRTALENDYERAAQKGGNLLDTIGSSQQSGEALRVRVAARTATLNQIALTGAFALQEILRKIAEWVGANPEQVVVVPNLDFADDTLTGKQIVELMSAKQLGAPISIESIHNLMQQRGVTELSFEEELERIEKEQELEMLRSAPESMDPDGPEDDPEDVEGDPEADDEDDQDPEDPDDDEDAEDDD